MLDPVPRHPAWFDALAEPREGGSVFRRLGIVGASLVVLLGAPAIAGPLVPAKPSSVIELNSEFGSGAASCPYGGLAADSVNNTNGTRQLQGFTVFDADVFVVTEVQFKAVAATSG